METNYGSPEIKSDVTDYFLGIINDCTTFNASDAEDKILTLELLLKEEGAGKDIIKKLDNAKILLSKLNSYLSHCKEHEEYFNQLRSSLAEIQESRLNIHYNKV